MEIVKQTRIVFFAEHCKDFHWTPIVNHSTRDSFSEFSTYPQQSSQQEERFLLFLDSLL
jgi:hypothetical protein